MNESLQAKFNKSDSDRKRILSLDGGGIRGILTLGILEKLEADLREKHGSNYQLCDHYDIIGGTSTGSIIAAGLAIGKDTNEIIDLYLNLGKEIFKKSKIGLWTRGWKTIRAFNKENYSSKKLGQYLSSEGAFRNITLGDQENLKCGLVINTKRADTYSLWTVTNHPDGKYYDANKHLRLADLCQASGSAPYYFKPKILNLRSRQGNSFDAAFIDGGVSLANNPAWQLFLVATVPSFGYKWKADQQNVSITSFGTGVGSKKEDPKVLAKIAAVSWASKIPDIFMTDALEMNSILMNAFGENKGPKIVGDGQFGDFSDLTLMKDKLFNFQRFNVKMDEKPLNELGFNFSQEKVHSLREMDYYENMETLLEIGRAYAKNLEFDLS